MIVRVLSVSTQLWVDELPSVGLRSSVVHCCSNLHLVLCAGTLRLSLTRGNLFVTVGATELPDKPLLQAVTMERVAANW